MNKTAEDRIFFGMKEIYSINPQKIYCILFRNVIRYSVEFILESVCADTAADLGGITIAEKI